MEEEPGPKFHDFKGDLVNGPTQWGSEDMSELILILMEEASACEEDVVTDAVACGAKEDEMGVDEGGCWREIQFDADDDILLVDRLLFVNEAEVGKLLTVDGGEDAAADEDDDVISVYIC